MSDTGDTGDSALRALADRLGLASSYTDIWGKEREVAPGMLQTALAAMGVDAARPDAARAALDTDAAADGLPPVWVVHEGAAASLQLSGKPAGPWTLTTEEGRRSEIESEDGMLRLPADLAAGYHRLQPAGAGTDADCTVICAPRSCWLPAALENGARWWGPCVQVYALRSAHNWGVGDFGDLLRLVEVMGGYGASFVGLSPLHALFPHRPESASPYSPASRNALNTLFIDVDAVPEFHSCPAARERVDSEDFQQRLHRLREADLVDYDGAATAKQGVLELVWQQFRSEQRSGRSQRARSFERFVREGGAGLRQHALFEALQAHLFAADPQAWGWPAWPAEYHDPDGAAVRRFAAGHEERVQYRAWLQWLADSQLQAVQQRATQLGMAIGLYRDLAVGVNEGGSETWAEPDLYALGMHVGAPPDALNALGQDWGLPPLNPLRLRAGRYRAFIATLRANMRHAGALRLDHVMALMRLFWIGAEGGTYVRYPFEDLLAILALESHRHRCMVVGEDLGTVEDSLREALERGRVLSYRPFYFEREDGGAFRAPAAWRRQALAVVSTHDLATLRGFWQGEDLALQHRLGLLPDDDAHAAAVLSRAQDRAQMLIALEREGLLPAGASADPASLPDATPAWVDAVHAWLARTPAMLLGVQLEDVTQQLLQVNVPGTGEDRFPNWRRKLSVGVEQLATDARMRSMAAVLRERRGGVLPDGAGEPMPALSTAAVPRSTYRVQFHSGMRFADVQAVVPYLHALGISHLYASPYLRARPGSTHGYDIVDHGSLNPEVGTEDEHRALCDALAAHGMGQLLDIVPNHMGVLEGDNAWWFDVLENGPASLYADVFDIDWAPPASEMHGRVLLPVLGDHYGRVLEAGELELVFVAEEGAFWLHYYDHRMPVDPVDYAAILRSVPMASPQDTDQEDLNARMESLLDAFARLPGRDATGDAERAVRARDRTLHKRTLARLVRRHAPVAAWVAGCANAFKGKPGEPHSFDALDALIARQAWRLAFWRVAGDDVNYRRFFDVNALGALRMERPEVFDLTHRRILRWLQEGQVQALRIDHPDGLSDPQEYFERLQQRFLAQQVAAGVPPRERRALYLLVEKILAERERLPDSWPVHGGTGYRFASLANGLFVDGRNEQAFDALYAEFTGHTLPYDQVLHGCKLLIIENALGSELNWLTEALYRITRSDRRTRDFTRSRLHNALAQLAACFPVYRSYIGPQGVSESDRLYTGWAAAEARKRSEGADVTVIDHVVGLLLGAPGEPEPALRAQKLRFVARWQQFTSPVMAKSAEDTAFYRYLRLTSLNDVGGEPSRFGTPVATFHAVMAQQAATRPHWMLATSTHDSKRSEDVRTRIDVLSEMPGPWREALLRWDAMAMPWRRLVEGRDAPSRNDECLLFQTLVGAWPLGRPDAAALADLRDRVQAYMQKAAREAKQATSWMNPNEGYEEATRSLIAALLEPDNGFVDDMQAFVDRIVPFGGAASLSLLALKLTAPGVPDVYHGCEHWNFSLVDPDNRRPVDFPGLAASLDAVQQACRGGIPHEQGWRALHATPEDGRIKHYLTWRLLQLRQQHPDLFRDGGYEPLEAAGPAARHVVAFARKRGPDRVVVLATRLLHTLCGGAVARVGDAGIWVDTEVPAGETASELADWLTGAPVSADAGRIPVAGLFGRLPVAVLVPKAWLA